MPFPPVPLEYPIESIKRSPTQDELLLYRTIQNNIHSLFTYLQRLRDGSVDETLSNVEGTPTVIRIIVTSGFTDTATIDFTVNADGSVIQAEVKPLSITSGLIANSAVIFTKIQDIAALSLLGNPDAFSGTVEEITVTGGIEFNAATIRSSAYTGDVTKPAGSTIQTIPNDTVTYAKMQNVSAASRLLLRGSAAGAGDIQEGTVGKGLAINTTILESTVSILRLGTQFDKTDATLASVTGLSFTVEAGAVYIFRVELYVDASAIGGSKYALAGTSTATSITYQIQLYDNASNALTINARHTALAGSTGQAGTTAGLCVISGTIVVANAGTFLVQFAQNVANGTSSVLVDSMFRLEKVG